VLPCRLCSCVPRVPGIRILYVPVSVLEIYASIMTVCSEVVTIINERRGKSPYKRKKMKH
jgi:hypothetical protein